jgi:hypothetical protein|tara:strand:+ start:184 stop:558 length:375 start_codon:yes stop_codon:yes gene_type:complete
MSDINHTVFVDSIGRAILGAIADGPDNSVNVKRPAIVHVQPNQETGQIAVQLIPYFFKEFNETEDDTVWSFPKCSIVSSTGLRLNQQLLQQYETIVNAAPGGDKAPPAEEPGVVKLFDDEDEKK